MKVLNQQKNILLISYIQLFPFTTYKILFQLYKFKLWVSYSFPLLSKTNCFQKQIVIRKKNIRKKYHKQVTEKTVEVWKNIKWKFYLWYLIENCWSNTRCYVFVDASGTSLLCHPRVVGVCLLILHSFFLPVYVWGKFQFTQIHVDVFHAISKLLITAVYVNLVPIMYYMWRFYYS